MRRTLPNKLLEVIAGFSTECFFLILYPHMKKPVVSLNSYSRSSPPAYTSFAPRPSCFGLRRNVGSPPIARSEILNARPLSPSEGAPQSQPLRWSDIQFCLLA